MKAGVAPATIARPMQPMRIERVAASRVEVDDQRPMAMRMATPTAMPMATATARAAGRRPLLRARAVTTGEVMPELLVEVGGE